MPYTFLTYWYVQDLFLLEKETVQEFFNILTTF